MRVRSPAPTASLPLASWRPQALDTYTKMSPFTHADKIKKPLLLIHGEADNNTGEAPRLLLVSQASAPGIPVPTRSSQAARQSSRPRPRAGPHC